MPIYEYRCGACGHQEEFLQKVAEPPIAKCPSCGRNKFRKLLSAAGFQLKGSGWYATDFKGGGKSATAEAKSDAKSEPKSEGKSGGRSEARSDTKAKSETRTEAKSDAKPVTTPTN